MIRFRKPRARKPCSRKPHPQPPGQGDVFNWLPERELVVGSGKPKRIGVMERLQMLYAPSKPGEGSIALGEDK
jgi:hypothetical protein